MLVEYYNIKTNTLSLPFSFNEELKDLSLDTQIIIFEEDYRKGEHSQFNQLVDTTHKNFFLIGAPKNNIIFGGDDLSSSLTHLTFGTNFNKPVDNLPENLTHLTLGYKFDQLVDHLPKNLTHLIFGKCFNRKVNNLPKTVTHLIFDNYFNKKVDNLPDSLTHLTLGNHFNSPIDNLPNMLRYLTLGGNFNQEVKNLPVLMEEITMSQKNQLKLLKKLPFNCKIKCVEQELEDLLYNY